MLLRSVVSVCLCCTKEKAKHEHLLGFIGEIRLGVIINAIQFTMQRFEAKETHFSICNLFDGTVPIRAHAVMIGGMAVMRATDIILLRWWATAAAMAIHFAMVIRRLAMIASGIVHSLFLCATGTGRHSFSRERNCSRKMTIAFLARDSLMLSSWFDCEFSRRLFFFAFFCGVIAACIVVYVSYGTCKCMLARWCRLPSWMRSCASV